MEKQGNTLPKRCHAVLPQDGSLVIITYGERGYKKSPLESKDRSNREGTCYPAIGTIAGELNLSVSTVKRAITDLEKNGFIRKKQRWRDNGGRSSLLFEIIK